MTRPARALSRRLKLIMFGFLLWISTLGVPAWAEGPKTADIMSPFDVADSHGVRISQFALNIDLGNAVTSPWKVFLTMVLSLAWSLYSWGIGAIGWALDFTMGMTWASYLTGAFSQASTAIRNNFLMPIGATSLTGGVLGALVGIGALMAIVTYASRGLSSGIMSALSSSAAAALAIGVFATPVAMIAGDDVIGAPLQYARGIGIELSAAVNGVDAPADPGLDDLPDNLKLSATLVDAFVRVVHQQYNYGASMDGAKCSDGSDAGEAYTAALKKGPVAPDEDDIRSAMGDCQEAYKKYADNANFSWLFVIGMFGLVGAALSGMVLTVILLTWLAVLTLCWAAFRTTYNALVAIVSPDAWSPLIKNVVDALVSLVQAATGPVVIAIIMRVVRGVFTDDSGLDLAVRFFMAFLLVVMGIVLLVINFVSHKKWGRSLWRKLAETMTPPGTNVKEPRGLSTRSLIAAEAAREGFRRFRPSRATGPSLPAPIQSAVQNAATGAALELAAGAATGGTGAAVVRGARLALTARKAAGATRKAIGTYEAIRHGAPTAGARQNALVPLARGHNVVQNKLVAATNAVTDRVESGRALLASGTSQPGRRATEKLTTGSRRVNDALLTAGRAKNQTITKAAEKVEIGNQIITGHRTKGRAASTATIGNRQLDAILAHYGLTRRGVDKSVEFATRQRVVEAPLTRSSAPRSPRRQVELTRPSPVSQPTPLVKPDGDTPAPKDPSARRRVRMRR